jgi:hypothetical protein
MLMTVMKRSPPYMASASAIAVSVLPTPEGPTKSSTPTGWLGLLMPACEMRMVSATV